MRTVYGSAVEPSLASGFQIPDEVVPMVTDFFRPRTGGDSVRSGTDADEAARRLELDERQLAPRRP
ncbi:hypothetical protein AB0K02_15985 [Streptomyces sp. NPDC049597]|uniref:hypothetical protein n=1 Tax=Streptomyces sp. NPDC049597 TaxID=3155276 RepID=UPI0034296CB9